MMAFIRQLGQVVVHCARKFWNHGASLRWISVFCLGCLVVFIIGCFVLAFLIPKYNGPFLFSAFITFCLGSIEIFGIDCYILGIDLQKARTIIGDASPEDGGDDDDRILLINSFQPRFPYRRLPVVTARALFWMCRDAVAFFRSACLCLADRWQKIVQEANKDA